MTVRMQNYSEKELTHIHDASMDLLKNLGVGFKDDEALGIFKENGFKVDGNTVFFSEQKVRQAIESAPARFRVAARNPGYSVRVREP